ncbi:MAG: Holliday junction branch migration DNA helicase RuvB [Simkaniaceae bacterium]
MNPSSFRESTFQKKDQVFEASIRPLELDNFIGQEQIKKRIHIITKAAKLRGDVVHHVLLHGPPGLGKTTLAGIISKEMNTHLVTTSGPSIEKAGDLAGLLTGLEEGDILFIDEIHRLNRAIEEYLYPAIEDFKLDLMLDSGPSARSVEVKLNRFTLVGATTRMGLLSSPLRSRFSNLLRLDYYSKEELSKILIRSSGLLDSPLDYPSSLEIGSRSRGTPRVANNLLRWVRDYSQIEGDGSMNLSLTKKALSMLNIDEMGLDEMDKKLLTVMIDHHNGGPVGLKTLSAAVGEETSTIEEVYEPFLLMQGFIKRTRQGREVTDLALNHLRRQ